MSAKPKAGLVPKEYVALAEKYLKAHSELRHWRGDFYSWDGQAWRAHDQEMLRADLYAWLRDKRVLTKGGKSSVPYDPNKTKVANLIEVLAGLRQLSNDQEPPFWIEPEKGDPDPADLLPFRNGVLHLKTGRRREPDRRLFALHRVECDYDPNATAPAWDAFLASSFPGEDEAACRSTIEEALGYTLAADRSQQKVIALIGEPRSGKSTIGRALKELLGPLYAGPTVNSFSANFGLQGLIGRQAAVVTDARDQRRADPNTVVERLLTISGQDTIDVDRKYKAPWTGQLGCQLWWVSNVLPKFRDPSGVVVTRLVAIHFRTSFLGREDPDLQAKLLAELPGIVNRALEGLERLKRRKRFEQPPTGEELLAELTRAAHPVLTWLEEECEKKPEHSVDCGAAYEHFREWCELNGHKPVCSSTTFGADLHAARIPGFKRKRLGARDKRKWLYFGFKIMPIEYRDAHDNVVSMRDTTKF